MMTPSKFVTSVLVTTAIVALPAIGSLSVSPHSSLGVFDRLSSALGLKTVALANSSTQKTKSSGLRYVPPKLPPRGGLQRTQGAGSRGAEGTVQVTLLTPPPQEATGQTTSGRPTFFWSVSFTPNPEKPQNKPKFPITLDFTLVRRGVAQPLVFKRMEINQLGLVKLAMPKDLPELQPGIEYRWTVSVVKDPVRRSMNPTFQSFVTRVALTPELDKRLKAATSDRDRAVIYAEAGMWYDALNAIGTNYLNKPNDASIRADLVTLLDQVGLPKVVEQKP
jgi:Domain of Unknown Function (DUF928)